jgi:hypothetical protein
MKTTYAEIRRGDWVSDGNSIYQVVAVSAQNTFRVLDVDRQRWDESTIMAGFSYDSIERLSPEELEILLARLRFTVRRLRLHQSEPR